jgi:hypothetical protein
VIHPVKILRAAGRVYAVGFKAASKFASRVLCLLALQVTLLTAGAYASCGPNSQPNYDDITDVQFARNGCHGFVHQASDMTCTVYWFYAGTVDAGHGSLSWWQPKPQGTYALAIPMASIQSLLQRYAFYKLNPGTVLMSDQRQAVLSVKRCGTVTRVMIYPRGQASEGPTLALFAALDTLITRAPRQFISEKVEPFAYTLLFEGQ